MVAATVTLTIAYVGDNNQLDDTAIKTMWEALVDSKTNFKLHCEDNTDYTSTTAPANPAGNSPKAIKDAAGANPYGLKFGDSNDDFNNQGAQDIVFESSEIKGSNFSSKSVAYTLTTKVYIGVWGIDSFEQKSGDTYVAKITPAIS